jgi:PPP family 3-phenylpropionic acid transporter
MTHPATKRNFAPRLAAFYAAYFVMSGIQLPYLPLWLDARGLDPRQIGFVIAIPTLARIVAVPIITRLSDRHGDLRHTLILLSFGAALGYLGLGFAGGFVAILLGMMLISIVSTPTVAVTDAYAMQGLARRAYGPVRVWGSIAFVGANIGAGLLIERLAPANVIWLIAGAAVAIALTSLLLAAPESQSARPEHVPIRASALWRRPAFLAIIAAASLIQASHALYYGFSAIQWTAAGLDGLSIGLLWATGVVAEIVLFALAGRLPPAIGPAVLLLSGAAGAVIRWTAMAFDPSGGPLFLLQALHGLSFGATHLGTVMFVARAAPAGLAATAQGAFATLSGAALAALMGLSGLLYEPYGAAAYLAMALSAALGGMLIFLMRRAASVAD